MNTKRLPKWTVLTLAAALCLGTILTIIALSVPAKPTMQFHNTKLQVVDMGNGTTSIQALVDVSVANVEVSGGLQFALNYNPKYMAPSDMTTNQPIAAKGDNAAFCQTPRSLCNQDGKNRDPFYKAGKGLYESYIDPTLGNHELRITRHTRTIIYSNLPAGPDFDWWSYDWKTGGAIKKFVASEDPNDTTQNLYIDATTGTPVHVLTLSFNVKVETLAEATKLFRGMNDPDGILGETLTGDYLLKLKSPAGQVAPDDSSVLPYWPKKNGTITPIAASYSGTGVDKHFQWDLPDILTAAASANGAVTVNAYGAYTDGTVSDISATLQTYSHTVRGTHTDGRQEDFTLYWGGEDGCTITSAAMPSDHYLFRWTKTDGTYDGGYTFGKIAADGTVTPVAPGTWYHPTGGKYTVTQSLNYPLGSGMEKYPIPISVALTVTPVTMTGVTAENARLVYPNDEKLPRKYEELALPSLAQITTDVVSGASSLTLPVGGWTPAYTKNMHDITGLNGNTTVYWDAATGDANVGSYAFTAAPKYGAANVQARYPWLTVAGEHTLAATRQITPVGGATDGAQYEVHATATGENGALTLQVVKRNGTSLIDIPDNTAFRVRLPGGTVIDPAWFVGVSGTPLATLSFTRERFTDLGVTGYLIQIQPGPMAEPFQSQRELVRRSINLGGVFEVAVTESGKAESNFIPKYVPPRPNKHTASYTSVDTSAETPALKKAFDFTGTRANLYPFYQNTATMDKTVVLPQGYSVVTTYDGMTGGEPGKLGTFRVDDWLTYQAAGGAWTNGKWTETVAGTPVTIQYGPAPFTHGANYDGFGRVENPAPKKEAIIKVQVRQEVAPVEKQALLLTYEGQGDAVTQDPDGQVARIKFNTRQLGYPDTQSVTLTLTNLGTVQVGGIYLDMAGESSAFVVNRPPATVLPAGASTTFTVTYRLGLAQGAYLAARSGVPLKVCSDNGAEKTFEAALSVTATPIWQVTVKTQPEDGSMGSGALIMGAVGGKLDETPALSTYEVGQRVWVLTGTIGEYNLKEAYYLKADGTKITLSEYTPIVTTAGKTLYSFAMPAQNVEVVLVFEEPLESKLRLKNLQLWSGVNDTALAHQLPLRRANDYAVVDPPASGTALDFAYPNYLVVIPAAAERSQIKLELREILQGAGVTDPADDLQANVKMTVDYGTQPIIYDFVADPAQPAVLNHASAQFDSPPRGEVRTATIVITVMTKPAAGETPAVLGTRTYTVKIARQAEGQVQFPLYPGNSPYGMIAGDDGITDKAGAQRAFNGADRFEAPYVPTKASGLTNTYWQEAFGAANYDRDETALFVFAGEPFDDYGPKEVYDAAHGPIAPEQITRTVEVALLDATAMGEKNFVTGFGGTQKVTLQVGAMQQGISRVADWCKDSAGTDYARTIRPGVYALTYTFTDPVALAGTATRTFTRPLIILPRNGDVDVSGGTPAAGDADAIWNRMEQPLGCEAPTYGGANLFRYRVCDCNNDRNLNDVDASAAQGGGTAVVEYYLPTDYYNRVPPKP